jgi:hypothetical protein
MRSDRRFKVAVPRMTRVALAMLWLIVGVAVASPGAVARAADAAPTGGAAGAAPAAPRSMPAESLARLRVAVGDRPVHLWDGPRHLKLHHARLEADGVTFEAWMQADSSEAWMQADSSLTSGTWAAERWAGGSGRDSRRPRELIRWSRIGRLERERSHAGLGALVGAGVGLLAMWYVLGATDVYTQEFAAFVTVPAVVVLPTLAGTFIGAIVGRRSTVWARPAEAGAAP